MESTHTILGFAIGFVLYFMVKFLIQTGLMMLNHYKQEKENNERL